MEKIPRLPWDEYFMKSAFLVAERSTCLHHHVGAVVVKNKRQICTGYNGPTSGEEHCDDRGECEKERLAKLRGDKAISGRGVDDCPVIHAESNAIYQAALMGTPLNGAKMYLTHQPCVHCAKAINQVGITEVIFAIPYADKRGLELFDRRGIKYRQIPKPNLEITVLE